MILFVTWIERNTNIPCWDTHNSISLIKDTSNTRKQKGSFVLHLDLTKKWMIRDFVISITKKSNIASKNTGKQKGKRDLNQVSSINLILCISEAS